MIRRNIRTRLPQLMEDTNEKVDQEAKRKDEEARKERKKRFDEAKHAKQQQHERGDQVLVKQRKTNTKPPYDPEPYTITETRGT